jgi:hypothetical protein
MSSTHAESVAAQPLASRQGSRTTVRMVSRDSDVVTAALGA